MYVDGFLMAVRTDRKDDYIALARRAAAIFKEYGALRVVETWADDVPVGELTSFPRAVKLEPDETCVFSWIEYPDKETRDICMEKSFKDPRMDADMNSMPFDGKRMIFGGFRAVVDE